MEKTCDISRTFFKEIIFFQAKNSSGVDTQKNEKVNRTQTKVEKESMPLYDSILGLQVKISDLTLLQMKKFASSTPQIQILCEVAKSKLVAYELANPNLPNHNSSNGSTCRTGETH